MNLCGRGSGNGRSSGLGWMMKLSMAAAHSAYKPTISLQHPDQIPYLHSFVLTE
jgi:hypothetical protein